MPVRKLVGCSAAAVVAVGAMFASIAPTRKQPCIASLSIPRPISSTWIAQSASISARWGRASLATDDPGPAVVERHDDNVGCETKSVTKQDAAGNSVTKTKTNC